MSGEPGLFSDVRFGVRPLIIAPQEKPTETRDDYREELGEMTIREIADRRLKKLRKP